MELVFRALADPSRRTLLDRLFECDGQTLTQLCERTAMTRFGVMKHLRVLAAADLVTTRRAGRTKLHHLNPVPILLLHERWITKYAARRARALGDLRLRLEEDVMGIGERPAAPPRLVYEVYIRTTPAKLWDAITRPDRTRLYFYGTAVESDWKVGSSVRHLNPGGGVDLDGTVLEFVPDQRLVVTFSAVRDPECANDRPSRVTWEIQPLGEACKLTLIHDHFDGITRTYQRVGPGWNPVLSGLKTLLETGEPLAIEMPKEAR